MLKRLSLVVLFICFIGSANNPLVAQNADTFQLENIFDLEYVSSPQISADGQQIVYQRNFMDIMDDRRRSNLWIINTDGSRHRP